MLEVEVALDDIDVVVEQRRGAMIGGEGDVCVVEVETKIPICIEQFKDFPRLGRFAIRDFEQTVAVGVVKRLIDSSSS